MLAVRGSWLFTQKLHSILSFLLLDVFCTLYTIQFDNAALLNKHIAASSEHKKKIQAQISPINKKLFGASINQRRRKPAQRNKVSLDFPENY